jgi:replicative DNA helicase
MDKIGLNKTAESKDQEQPDVIIPETLDKYQDRLFQNIGDRMKRGRKFGFVGYDWGLNYIDKDNNYKISGLNSVLNGLNPELYIITGGSTVGKTTFCRQLMDEIVLFNNWLNRKDYKDGKTYPDIDKETGEFLYKGTPDNNVGCIYFSYEQGINELQIKTLSRINSINGNTINRGTITDEQYKKITGNIQQLERFWKYQVIYEAEFQTTVRDIEEISLRVKEMLGVNHLVIFVDYLQIIKAEIPSLSDVRGVVEYNISELRRFVRKYPDISVIAISSVARGKADEKGLETGKESGLIEYTADVVINLTTDWDTTKENNEEGKYINYHIDLSVVKNRNNGELKTIPLIFTPSYQRFKQNNDKPITSISISHKSYNKSK